MDTVFKPCGPLLGEVRPPPDKSISHRAALLAAMSEGRALVRRYLDSADTRSTLRAIEAVGADVRVRQGGIATDRGGFDVEIGGVGLRGALEPDRPIDVGNAGTLLRLMPGWLAAQKGRRFALDGDESIRRRPVDRIVEPLRRMGAELDARDGRLPPLVVTGMDLCGIDYVMPVASAQVKSAILLAGLNASSRVVIRCGRVSRDHTERMLRSAGVEIEVERRGDGEVVSMDPVERIVPGSLEIPGDPSSAAFFVVAATLVPRSDVRIVDMSVNPTRIGAIEVMKRMGASIVQIETGTGGSGDPTGDLRVRSADLRATTVTASEVPALIDELPLIALLAAYAEGTTVVEGASELRYKESDRIAGVVATITALGGCAQATANGFIVTGTGGLRGGVVESHGDHRIAMLGAIAGLASVAGANVCGMEAHAVSYPDFVRDLEELT